tara:strand:+ start:276 stop:701 length:426 start_codon:yes stop_codon:yes gene_type:complete
MAGIGDYAKKQKGKRGFKMEMKEYGKGKSPFLAGGADATLVNAAQNAAMANKPGDWSASLNKQYEGINEATKAKGKMGEQIITGAIDLADSYVSANTDKKIKEGSAEGATDEQIAKGEKAQATKDRKNPPKKKKKKKKGKK